MVWVARKHWGYSGRVSRLSKNALFFAFGVLLLPSIARSVQFYKRCALEMYGRPPITGVDSIQRPPSNIEAVLALIRAGIASGKPSAELTGVPDASLRDYRIAVDGNQILTTYDTATLAYVVRLASFSNDALLHFMKAEKAWRLKLVSQQFGVRSTVTVTAYTNDVTPGARVLYDVDFEGESLVSSDHHLGTHIIAPRLYGGFGVAAP